MPDGNGATRWVDDLGINFEISHNSKGLNCKSFIQFCSVEFANRQAGFFAARVRREAGENLEAQVTHAFRLATARDPNPRELATLTTLAKNHNLEQACRVLFNTSAFLTLP